MKLRSDRQGAAVRCDLGAPRWGVFGGVFLRFSTLNTFVVGSEHRVMICWRYDELSDLPAGRDR